MGSRLCLRILDKMGVPTPKRIEVNRDGGPRLESAELAAHMKEVNGVVLEGPEDGTGGGARTTLKVELLDDGDHCLWTVNRSKNLLSKSPSVVRITT